LRENHKQSQQSVLTGTTGTYIL